jgi:hypothetical protein
MTAEIGAEFLRGSLHRADARRRFDDRRQSSHKEQGDVNVIENKEK